MPVGTPRRLLAVTLPLYFAWEMLQAPFFTGMPAQWGYAPSQPVLPVVRVGILPVLQPIVLLPLVFWLAAKWEGAW